MEIHPTPVLMSTLLALCVACDKGGEPKQRTDSVGEQAAVEPGDGAAAEPGDETAVEPGDGAATVEGREADSGDSVETGSAPGVEGEVAEVEAGAVPIAKLGATAEAPTWQREVAAGEAVALVDLQAGVLGHGASGYYDLSESGELAMRPEIEAAPNEWMGEWMGVWPKDTWSVEHRCRPKDEVCTYRLMRVRGARRWVPQTFADYGQRFDDEGQQFRKSNTGGMLGRVEESADWLRIADGGQDPSLGVFRGSLVELVETRAKEFYTVSRDDQHLYVQAVCEDEACVEEGARSLPLGMDWSFGRQITRRRHSVSVLASVAGREFLLHYGKQGWILDELGGAVDGLWPTKDGGLWTLAGGALQHRDPSGGWRSVQLPAGMSTLSVAVTADLGRLWIAGLADGEPALFSIHTNLQEPL